MRYLVVSLCAVFASQFSLATTPIDGVYWNDARDALVSICQADGELVGSIVWQASPSMDVNNPDARLRERPIVGIRFLQGFRRNDRSGKWEGGRVYSPDNGATYKGRVWLESANTLKMRGYVGVSILGRTEVFTRAVDPLPADIAGASLHSMHCQS